MLYNKVTNVTLKVGHECDLGVANECDKCGELHYLPHQFRRSEKENDDRMG